MFHYEVYSHCDTNQMIKIMITSSKLRAFRASVSPPANLMHSSITIIYSTHITCMLSYSECRFQTFYKVGLKQYVFDVSDVAHVGGENNHYPLGGRRLD